MMQSMTEKYVTPFCCRWFLKKICVNSKSMNMSLILLKVHFCMFSNSIQHFLLIKNIFKQNVSSFVVVWTVQKTSRNTQTKFALTNDTVPSTQSFFHVAALHWVLRYIAIFLNIYCNQI